MNLFQSLNPTTRSRTSEYVAKVWMFIAIVFVAINLLVVLTLLQIAPKLTVIPQVLTSPMTSQDFIQTEPLYGKVSDRELLDETLIRYYLDMRLSQMRDIFEMRRRWGVGGPVQSLSSPTIYNTFATAGDTTVEERLKKLQSQNHTVSVQVTDVSRWDNTFVVNFDLYYYSNGSVRVEHRTATIEVRFNRSRQFRGKTVSNPYGLTVVTYTERKKNQ